MGSVGGVQLADLQLRDDRIHLRRWRPRDARRVYEIMQDRGMREFLALPDPYTGEDAARWVGELGHEGRDDGTGLGSAVVESSTGRLVGSATLRLQGDPEIGYWVAPDARGHGYAARASRLLATWGFGVGLRRVRLACDVRNLASARTALAAGFRFEGIARDGVTGGGRHGVPARIGDLARFARLSDDPDAVVPPRCAPLPPGGLDDGVLALRPTLPGDAAAMAETEDRLTLRWSFTGTAPSADDVRRAAGRAGLEWLVNGVATMSMIDVASGEYAGQLRLRQPGPPQVGLLGYVVHPRFRGRGYTSRALRLVVPWAFGPADLARLELGARLENVASQRAALAAGFEHDGVRRRRLRGADGAFHDEARFALVNPRYR